MPKSIPAKRISEKKDRFWTSSKRSVLCLFLLFLVVGDLRNLSAFEMWDGVVITNNTLRKAPDSKGDAIISLQRGDKVVVKNKKGRWYNVIIGSNEYGYRGWIYEKYLTQVEMKRKQDSPEIQMNQIKQTKQLPGNIPEPLTQNNDDKRGGPVPHDPLKFSGISDKEKVPIFGNTQHFASYQGISAFFLLILKLSTILLSTLALFISYRALKIARLSQHMKTHIQENGRPSSSYPSGNSSIPLS